MPFNFPGSPTIGQTYEPSPGVLYQWNGESWDRAAPPAAPQWMPAGVIAPFAGTVLPQGTLWCDGSTFAAETFPQLYAALGNKNVLPDLRGRVIVGLDTLVGGAYANRITNTGIGHPGLDSKVAGATGGFDRYTIVGAQIPAHGHTGSGTTSGESVDHVHGVNGSTGYISADHSHGGSGTTSAENVDHAHYTGGPTDAQGDHAHLYDRYTSAGTPNTQGGPSQPRVNEQNWTSTTGAHAHNFGAWSGGRNAAHVHTYSFNTGGVSANHYHAIAFNTGGVNVNHTHSYNFTSSMYGGGEAHPNVQPSIVLAFIIFTGAPT